MGIREVKNAQQLHLRAWKVDNMALGAERLKVSNGFLLPSTNENNLYIVVNTSKNQTVEYTENKWNIIATVILKCVAWKESRAILQ
jgi:hypothetical protein